MFCEELASKIRILCIRVSFSLTICSCLLDNCNFLLPTFLTRDVGVFCLQIFFSTHLFANILVTVKKSLKNIVSGVVSEHYSVERTTCHV